MCISLLLGIYGTYPAVFTDPDHAESTLRNYCDGVLYKDLFALAGIRQNEKFMHLVKLLAYNVGSEVNYDNLARDTGLSRTTVADYLQLLEQCFIIKICPSFSRNLRKLFKSTLTNRLHRNLACVIDKSSRGAKLKRAFEELPQKARHSTRS